MNFELLVLGTGSATPVLEHNPSAYLLTIENEHFLIDCGEGTQFRLLEHKVRTYRIRHIFISHLHGDHYFGLIGLLSSWNLNQRKDDLTIYAPKELAEILTIQFKYSHTFLHFKINFVETDTTAANVILDNSLLSVETIPLIHRINCCGFLFKTKESKRKLLADKLPENFPIPYIKQLKEGFDVEDALTGKVYKNEDYTAEGAPPKSFAYCSDTAYNEAIIPQLQQVNTIFHEATFLETELKRAIQTNHSTAQQAATIALKANARQLIIGHYSSRYKTLENHLSEAKAVFENTQLAQEGLTFKL
ncbi:ribonuclease Z [Emticicia agri]|uniref:Ribonuclease Z n=1 Tax=Emticicia agri TaxID=2492393 RepID=A0A4Q5M1N7_9BACT|nr:ribonuclease Z [Emticicia agri]RYU96151.1 ribonuclease Z [Emticicia agri]